MLSSNEPNSLSQYNNVHIIQYHVLKSTHTKECLHFYGKILDYYVHHGVTFCSYVCVITMVTCDHQVLVYDKHGQDIISPLMNVKELRKCGVTLHL